ncbi:hypothetical protein RHMOL_Rhmol08G0168100 [Rhododendron molle]|uniref:Uncharacterized protein n=1 Tax=Rhododendron molle TaxID=49168 RepID=A0ACC0MR66_RHOML|nr:hypothetical protein RHMOL_Rhmol08G0168100 [Rhododendron molle]
MQFTPLCELCIITLSSKIIIVLEKNSTRNISFHLDCGVHTCKYFDLEQFNEKESAKLKFKSKEGRKNLLLELMLCGENNNRNVLIRKAQQKYSSTRRKI